MRTSVLFCIASSLLHLGGSAPGPTPIFRKVPLAEEVPLLLDQNRAFRTGQNEPVDDLQRRHYMLELAEELHHTLAARHKRLRQRLDTRRARRSAHGAQSPQARPPASAAATPAVGREGRAVNGSLPTGEAAELGQAPRSVRHPARKAAASLVQLRAAARSVPAWEGGESLVSVEGDRILATWREQLVPATSIAVWAAQQAGTAEAPALAALATPLALLDVGSAAVGGASGMGRLASLARELAERWQCAFIQSFWTVVGAEVFDKTLLVVLLCALAYGARAALQGALVALASHLTLAALFGLFITHVVPVSTMHFTTAGLLSLFFIFYVNDWMDSTDPRVDQFEDGHAADAHLPCQDGGEAADAKAPDSPVTKQRVPDSAASVAEAAGFACCFFPVFLAEWADRTQVVLIALNATLPVVPVCCGAACALALLVLVAVFPAVVFGRQRFSERTVAISSALGLLLFTAAALWSGIKARRGW